MKERPLDAAVRLDRPVRRRRVLVQREEPVEVTAGRERATPTSEHGDPRVVVAVDVEEDRLELHVHCGIDGVQLVGTVEPHPEHRSITLDDQRFVFLEVHVHTRALLRPIGRRCSDATTTATKSRIRLTAGGR